MDAAVEPRSPRWRLYRVLAEPQRLRLLALSGVEELTIGELSELVGESQPNVSRHVAPLRESGLVVVRKQGTRTFVRLADGADADAVVADALAAGREALVADGTLAKVDEVLRNRDVHSRELFERGGPEGAREVPGDDGELPLGYLRVFAHLLDRRALAVDVGTGDGALLDVLAPVFDKVLAVDRSGARVDRAKRRIEARGWKNVALVRDEVGSPALAARVGEGADCVVAARIVHHAPKPKALLEGLAALARPGGAVVVVDYARHDDERMREQGDVWLGFEPGELRRFALSAGLERVHVEPLGGALRGKGPDAHLPWQILVGRAGPQKRSKRS